MLEDSSANEAAAHLFNVAGLFFDFFGQRIGPPVFDPTTALSLHQRHHLTDQEFAGFIGAIVRSAFRRRICAILGA
ncbi:MAG: hypothetical protein WCA36_14920 [Pseudolabrys sp.]